MKKKNIILTTSVLCVIIGISILIILNPFKKNVWDSNFESLKNSFDTTTTTYIEDLSKFTPFQWDTLYSFSPYTPKEEIYKIVGYKWDDIDETSSENMNQIVFISDGKVVCYIYGYPENMKFSFNFGKYEGTHIKLSAKDNSSFKVTTKDNIKYIDYIK